MTSALRPHRQDFLRRSRQVRLVRDHLGFSVVDQQHVDQFQHFGQLAGSAVDPEIHRVAARETNAVHLPPHRGLQRRVNVRQKQEVGVSVFLGNLGLELLEHVQLREVGLRFVQVVGVVAAPAEGLAGRALNAARIDAAFLQNILMLGAKIVAHHGDHAHFVK